MLEDAFRAGPPLNNTTLKSNKQVGNLSNESCQFILLKSWQNWKPSQTAEILGISSHSVRSVLRRFRSAAHHFFTANIVVRIASPDRRRVDRYLCRIHGEQFSKQSEAGNHCWGELFGPESSYERARLKSIARRLNR